MTVQNYSLEISEYTSELKTLAALSKLIVTKNQLEADLFEQDVIADTITFNYQPNSENWIRTKLYVGINANATTVKSEKYWVEYMIPADNPYSEISINTEAQELWVRITPTIWREVFSGKVRPEPDAAWATFSVTKGIIITYDLYKALAFTSSTVWYEKTSGRTSNTLPTTVEATADGKVYQEGLSELISTPEEYVTATYQIQANPDLTAAERTAYENAIASLQAEGDWEDVRISMYLRDANDFLLIDAQGQPTLNTKRFKKVAFRGEKNTYYRRLVADSSIDPFVARTTGDFEILSFQYTNTLDKELIDHFVELYRQNIQIFKHTIYNQAFKSQESYRSWCSYYINWMTLMRYESAKMGNIHDVDLMSSRDVTNALYSASLFEFDDIPLTYKRRIVKATERLLARKGTSQVFEDILSLFNLDKDVSLLKYYLVKHYPTSFGILEIPQSIIDDMEAGDFFFVNMTNDAGEFTVPYRVDFDTTMSDLVIALRESGLFNSVDMETGSNSRIIYSIIDVSISIENIKKIDSDGGETFALMKISDQPDWFRPDLAFLETDINARSIQEGVGSGFNSSKLRDFENFISKDPRWQASREELLEKNFSTIQSKYFSVSTAIDVVNNGVAVAMLWGMLKQYQTSTSRENMNILTGSEIPGITNITFFEAMIGMLCLTLWKHGVDDIIPHEASGIDTIVGLKYTDSTFPNENNLLPFSTKIVLPTSGTSITPDAITNAVDDNIEIYRNVQRYVQGFVAPVQSTALKYVLKTNGEAYQDYKHLRDVQALNNYKFTAQVQYDCFAGYDKYSDFLEAKNPEFRVWLADYDNEDGYNDGILFLTTLVENAISTENFSFSLSTGVNTLILDYVERMIRFFKSYTVDLKEINTYMQIDDPNFESIHLMNIIKEIAVSNHYKDSLKLTDWFKLNYKRKLTEQLSLTDRVLKVLAYTRAKDSLAFVEKTSGNKASIKLQEYVPGVDSQLCWDVWRGWQNSIKNFDKLITRDFVKSFRMMFNIPKHVFTFTDAKTFNAQLKLNAFDKSVIKAPMRDKIVIKSKLTPRECLVIETNSHEDERTFGSMTDRETITVK